MLKPIISIVFLLQINFLSHSQVFTNLEIAKKVALGTNSLIVVDFWADWCNTCLEMNEKVWSRPEIKKSLESFIFVSINTVYDKKYKIKSYPTIVVIDGNGIVYDKFIGYKNSMQTRRFLEENELDTEYISFELIEFYKTPTYSNCLRLIYKMYDYSLLAEDHNLRNKVVNVCNEYIEVKAEKLIDGNDTNAKWQKQKVQLLKLYKEVYTLDFKTLKEKLSKFSYSDILEEAQYDYLFLSYLVNKSNDMDTSSIESKLKELDFENVINKANKIIEIHKAIKE